MISYTAGQLLEWVESKSYRTLKNIPISLHRARSQANNPRLQAQDIVMICAMENEQILGYMGMLPDDLHTPEGSVHLAWLSGFWVDPKMRGKKIGQSLMEEAIAAWKGRLVSTEYAPASLKIYERTGHFNVGSSLEGIKLYVNSDTATWFPPRHVLFRWAKPAFKLLDGLANLFAPRLDIENWESNLRYEESDHLSELFTEIVEEHKKETLFRRGFREWSWMLNHPWILNKGGSDRRYHFSSAEKRFSQRVVTFYDSLKKVHAVLLLTIRRRSVKVIALYAKQEAMGSVLYYLQHLARSERLATILSYEPELNKALESENISCWLKRKMTRQYLVGSGLAPLWPGQAKIMSGDGDVGFT